MAETNRPRRAGRLLAVTWKIWIALHLFETALWFFLMWFAEMLHFFSYGLTRKLSLAALYENRLEVRVAAFIERVPRMAEPRRGKAM
jgi:hypothetical protein